MINSLSEYNSKSIESYKANKNKNKFSKKLKGTCETSKRDKNEISYCNIKLDEFASEERVVLRKIKSANLELINQPQLTTDKKPSGKIDLNIFPNILSNAIKAISEEINTPVEISIISVLSAITHLAQPRVNSESPSPHKNHMPCSLNFLGLAGSGLRKSAAFEAAFKEIKSNETIKVNFQNKAIKFQPLYSDITYEGLIGSFISGQPYATLATDEGGQFFGGYSLTSPAAISMLGGLTKAYDNGSISRLRSSGNEAGSGSAEGRRLSISLLSQEITIREALSNELFIGQGFLARFILLIAESNLGTRTISENPFEKNKTHDIRLQNFWSRCNEIIGIPISICKSTGSPTSSKLELSSHAQIIWIDFYNKVELQLIDGENYSIVKEFASRAGEHALRLSTVIAYFDDCKAVSQEHMLAAIQVVELSLDNWIYYFSYSDNSSKNELNIMINWLKKQTKPYFDNARLSQFGPSFIRRKSQKREAILEDLSNTGHIYYSEENNIYIINPHLNLDKIQ